MKTLESIDFAIRTGKSKVRPGDDGNDNGNYNNKHLLQTTLSRDSSTNITQVIIEFNEIDIADSGGNKKLSKVEKLKKFEKSINSKEPSFQPLILGQLSWKWVLVIQNLL